MLLIFGLKEVFLNRTIALRLELVVQIMFFYYLIIGYADVYNTQYDQKPEDYASIARIFNVLLLFRLMRIGEFLSELEQW